MIIDVRCRPPTPPFLAIFKSKVFTRVLQRVGPLGIAPSFDKESIELFFKEMDEAGISTGVITGRNVPLGGIENEHIAELVSQNPSRLIGIGGIDPTDQVHQALPEVEKCIKELGMKPGPSERCRLTLTRLVRPWLAGAILWLTASAVLAASPLNKSTYMVPVRDGTRLATDLYLPAESEQPLPVILMRTPYSKANGEGVAAAACRRAPTSRATIAVAPMATNVKMLTISQSR